MGFMVICVLMFFFGFAMAYTPDTEQGGGVNFLELEEIIDHMNETKNKLKNIDRLLLDLLVADEENEQIVNFLWDDLTKQGNKYSFTVSGDSHEMIETVKAEQERLRSSLLEDVDRINRLRSRQNGGKNDERG